jgi:hypothetical protein
MATPPVLEFTYIRSKWKISISYSYIKYISFNISTWLLHGALLWFLEDNSASNRNELDRGGEGKGRSAFLARPNELTEEA